MIIAVGALLVLIGVSGYFIVKQSQHDIIEYQSLEVADIVVTHARAVRSVYNANVVAKLEADGTGYAEFRHKELAGTVPLPAQFIKSVSGKASENSEGLFRYRPVSRWNLSPDQGLSSEFLKSAWLSLEMQDELAPNGPIDWKPVHTIEMVDGEETLKYLQADPAVSDGCVTCHNDYELLPKIVERRLADGVPAKKQWKKHQLMGAFYVEIPLSGAHTAAIKNSTESIVWIIIFLIGGLILFAYFIVGDVTKAHEKTKKLYWQSRHDALTGLPNRVLFEEAVSSAIIEARTNKTTHYMCYLDLDNFKIVNDSCGHAAGDELLCQVGLELKSTIKKSDTLARLGGDEFGLLLENCTETRAVNVAESLCKKLQDFHFVNKEQVFDIGVSIGLVEINANTESIEKVLSYSDIACYAAKDSGRNRVQLYRENNTDISTRSDQMSWVSRILLALDEGRLVLYAQEISAIANDANHTHYEVLVRFQDEQGNIIPPDEFLPAAERYDLMKKVDTYIISRAFEALKNKAFKGLGETDFISINLSGQSLSDANFLDSVTGLIEKHDIDPQQICFEVTETSAIKNPNLVRRFMYSLKSRGVRFALDDFGTGLSSLTYLKQFPVDYLKIDGSFVKDILTNPVDRKLVTAINQLAHTLNIKTIAEYVESEEILELLAVLGVDYAQGYYINKPTALKQ